MLVVLWNIACATILICVAALGFMHTFGSVPSLRRYKLIQKIPGPEGVFYFGNTFQLLAVSGQDKLNYMIEKFKGYDRFMKAWLLGYSTVFLKDPDDIQIILSSNDHLRKGLEYSVLNSWLNEGLLTSTGEKWRKRRKMFTPAFHFKILEDNLITFNKDAKILCEKLRKTAGKGIELESYITLCTLDVITGTAMGISLNAQAGAQKYVNELKTLSETTAKRWLNPFLHHDLLFYMSSAGRMFQKSIRYMHEFSRGVINDRKNLFLNDRVDADNRTISSSGKIRRAFLDLMLELESSRPGTFSDDDIREEVDTFMFEGHDTTATAIHFILFNLARYQDVQQKVYEELADIFGDSERDVTSSDLQKMNYLEKVIKESLRLYPSVPAISRMLEKDVILNDGVVIPASANVIIPIFILHRHSGHWPDPERFDPERFTEENIKGRHPYSYIPFSAGPRNCIGQKFALMELKTVVTTIVRKLKILPVTKEDELNLAVYLVLRSSVPIKLKISER